jgi:hypothetical protein
MLAKDVTIAVEVVNNRIVCDPATTVFNGRRVRWARYPSTATFEFRLRFEKGCNSNSNNTWPFAQPAPANNQTAWGDDFEATIAGNEDASFKYTVEVQNAPGNPPAYDPMIIVGRG